MLNQEFGDLATKLHEAGIAVYANELRQLATKHIQQNDDKPYRALRPFVDEVCAGAGLLVQLIGARVVDEQALVYLKSVAESIGVYTTIIEDAETKTIRRGHDMRIGKPRGLADIAAIQGVLLKSVFNTFRVPDGRPLGLIRYHELIPLADKYQTCARVFKAIAAHGVPADKTVYVKDFIKEKDAKKIIGK